MKTITLTLPYPISANAYWGTRVVTPKGGGKPLAMTFVTHEARNYKTEIGWLLKAAGIIKPIAGRIRLDIKLYPQRPQDWQKRQRDHGESWDDTVRCIDLDNANKVLLDAMKDIAFDDDKWVREMHAERMEPDAHGARVVVTITALAVEQPQAAMFDEVPA